MDEPKRGKGGLIAPGDALGALSLYWGIAIPVAQDRRSSQPSQTAAGRLFLLEALGKSAARPGDLDLARAYRDTLAKLPIWEAFKFSRRSFPARLIAGLSEDERKELSLETELPLAVALDLLSAVRQEAGEARRLAARRLRSSILWYALAVARGIVPSWPYPSPFVHRSISEDLIDWPWRTSGAIRDLVESGILSSSEAKALISFGAGLDQLPGSGRDLGPQDWFENKEFAPLRSYLEGLFPGGDTLASILAEPPGFASAAVPLQDVEFFRERRAGDEEVQLISGLLEAVPLECFDTSSLAALEMFALDPNSPPLLRLLLMEALFNAGSLEVRPPHIEAFLDALAALDEPRAYIALHGFFREVARAAGTDLVAISVRLSTAIGVELTADLLSSLDEEQWFFGSSTDPKKVRTLMEMARRRRSSRAREYLLWHALFIVRPLVRFWSDLPLTLYSSVSGALDDWPIHSIATARRWVATGAISPFEAEAFAKLGQTLPAIFADPGVRIDDVWHESSDYGQYRQILEQVFADRDSLEVIYGQSRETGLAEVPSI